MFPFHFWICRAELKKRHQLLRNEHPLKGDCWELFRSAGWLTARTCTASEDVEGALRIITIASRELHKQHLAQGMPTTNVTVNQSWHTNYFTDYWSFDSAKINSRSQISSNRARWQHWHILRNQIMINIDKSWQHRLYWRIWRLETTLQVDAGGNHCIMAEEPARCSPQIPQVK